MDKASFQRRLDEYVAAWKTYQREAIEAVQRGRPRFLNGRVPTLGCPEFTEVYTQLRG